MRHKLLEWGHYTNLPYCTIKYYTTSLLDDKKHEYIRSALNRIPMLIAILSKNEVQEVEFEFEAQPIRARITIKKTKIKIRKRKGIIGVGDNG